MNLQTTPQPPEEPASGADRPMRTTGAWLAMTLGVLLVYRPAQFEYGKVGLAGHDFLQLHYRRMSFAQDALFGEDPHLPGWYPRELMGTPFWSNVQNFP